MFRIQKVIQKGTTQVFRKLSTETSKSVTVSNATQPPVKAAAATASSAGTGGSTFFQRFSSFLAGCGVGFGVSFYFIYNELVESNEHLLRNIKQIEGFKGK